MGDGGFVPLAAAEGGVLLLQGPAAKQILFHNVTSLNKVSESIVNILSKINVIFLYSLKNGPTLQDPGLYLGS